MEIPFSRWYGAIERRRSRRKFEARHLKPKTLNHLKSICSKFQPFPDARSVLVTRSPENVFKGAIGSYGKIKGAPAFIAFIGDSKSKRVNEHVGFTGEGIILESEAMGLNTCWVGGHFKPDVVESMISIGENETVCAVTPIGYAPDRLTLEEKLMAGFGLRSRRKELSKLVIGLKQSAWHSWVKPVLDAARLAPSRMNRQPWRFHVEKDSIVVAINRATIEKNSVTSERLCCGIAMLHIEVAAKHFGVSGEWVYLDSPLVAKFQVG
jgi:nitroreductase